MSTSDVSSEADALDAPIPAVAHDDTAPSDAEEDDAVDMDALVCTKCGSVLCVHGGDEDNGSVIPAVAHHPTAPKPAKQQATPKPKITPGMLRCHVVRKATRVAMLCASARRPRGPNADPRPP